MKSTIQFDAGIATLLDLHGQVLDQGDGYWIKIEAWRVEGDSNTMKAIVVGIMSQDRMRERVLAIAKGEYKPKPSEPKIWFTSMRSLAEVLSDENRALLKVIRESKPESIRSLAIMTGRQPSNLSRTLKTMSNYGFVEMKRENKFLRPIAKATEFRIVVDRKSTRLNSQSH